MRGRIFIIISSQEIMPRHSFMKKTWILTTDLQVAWLHTRELSPYANWPAALHSNIHLRKLSLSPCIKFSTQHCMPPLWYNQLFFPFLMIDIPWWHLTTWLWYNVAAHSLSSTNDINKLYVCTVERK
jgi:hypothetical protein